MEIPTIGQTVHVVATAEQKGDPDYFCRAAIIIGWRGRGRKQPILRVFSTNGSACDETRTTCEYSTKRGIGTWHLPDQDCAYLRH